MKATFKLINSYYIKGFFGPFFVVIFPILLLFIIGNAMVGTALNTPDPIAFMRNLVAGITITALLSTGLFGLPMTIIEFKKSTLIKRIGSADISKTQFFISVLIYQCLWAIFSYLWVLLWGGIIIGTKSNFDWSVSFSQNFWISMPYALLAVLISMTIGLVIVAFFNTVQGVMGVTNVIYLPISFLSGGFLPKEQIDSSSILTWISYCLPTKYAVDPFFISFQNGQSGISNYGWEAYGYPMITIAISVVFLAITIKMFKWSK